MEITKSQLCPVLFLVTSSVMLHLVAAQSDVIAIEKMVKMEMEKFELKMMQVLQAYLQHHNSHVETEYTCDAEFQKVQNISNAQHQEVIEKFASHEATVERMAEAINHLRENESKLLASQSDLQKQLTSKNDRLQGSQSDVQKQLMSLRDELDQIKINVLPSSCTTMSIKSTNTYYIRPYGTAGKPFLVLCDFENNYKLGGGWTVFQRRFNGIENFYRNWTMYKNGFGDVYGEHWLGLEKLHLMTRMGRHELLVLLEDFEGKSTYAFYEDFRIGNEVEKYKLTVGKYSGTAGDSLKYHNGMKFSTYDQHNDLASSNCAAGFAGAWWFNKCYFSHLNGQYHQKGYHLKAGATWIDFKGLNYSLKSTKMMLRSHSK